MNGLQLLNRRSEAEIERLLAATQQEGPDDSEGRLVCGHCGQAITDHSEATEVAGRHEHRLTNPAGIEFRVRCFRRAPGCASVGELTDAYTWFPGCWWRYALCRRCGVHLGWSYSGAEHFFGLIPERLRHDRTAGP